MQDGALDQSGLSAMPGNQLRLLLRQFGEALLENLRGASVQFLAPTPQQAFVGRVLYQSVFEAIVGVGQRALEEQDVGLREPLQRCLQHWSIHVGE